MIFKSFKGVATLGATALMLVALTACGGSSSSTKAVDTTPVTTTIAATKKMASLSIGAYETLAAPSGMSLSLTVDGVETPMVAGTTYTSSAANGVVLEVTEQNHVKYDETFQYDWRVGAYIENGRPVTNRSVTSAVQGVTLTDDLSSLDGATIKSNGPGFNGVVITSTGTQHVASEDFTISNLNISLRGNGGDGSSITAMCNGVEETFNQLGNDFSGWGAGIVTQGYSKSTINNASIYTEGIVRTAILVKEHSQMTFNKGYIEVHGTDLPSWYVNTPPVNVAMGYMVAAPWMLGIQGTCRATNLLDYGQAVYNDSTIIADNWGALSVDSNTLVTLHVNNCKTQVNTSGYSSYTIGGSSVYYDSCTIDVPDMAIIGANGPASAYMTNDTVTSGRFGMMVWGNSGGNYTVDGGTWSTAKALFILKSAWSNVSVSNNAVMTTTNGHILETVVNDDSGGGPVTGGGDATASFTDTALVGDIIHSNLNGNLAVTIGTGGSITGAITTATAVADATTDGVTLGADTYQYMSAFTYTYAPSTTGLLTLALTGTGSWTINATSYVSSLASASTSSLIVPAGKTLTITQYDSSKAVVGTPATYAAGTYTGLTAIVLTPAASTNYFELAIS